VSDKSALYLASTSPRRRELLGQMGVQLATLLVDVDETLHDNEDAGAYVQRLSRDKAAAGWDLVQRQELLQLPVLGADTTVVLDGQVLGKPSNQEQCTATLLALSGRVHKVMTSVTIRLGNMVSTELSVTDVTLRTLSEDEVIRYWHTGEPQDKAGGYGIQGYGAVFVEAISGSYSGVVGLPIEKTVILLNQFNVPYWQDG